MENIKSFIKNIDKGFYDEARRKGVHALELLRQGVRPEEPEVLACFKRIAPRYGVIEDGSPHHARMVEWAEKVCALEKLMGAAGIRRGDTVEKAFFSSGNASGTQGIFPAFLASQIIAGQMAVSLVPVFCLSEVRINSHVQEKVLISDTTATRQLNHITEGADLPKTTISKTQGSIALQKYGRMLEASYESVRLMTLDIIGLQLQRIGRQVGIDETDDMLETLIAGDGNASSSGAAANVGVSGTLAYTDIVAHWQAFGIGYEQRHSVTNDSLIANIVNLAEFKDPMAGFQFTRNGVLPGALGATYHRWTSTGSASFGTTKLLSVDDRLAMVLYREGDMLEEADQLIDKQIHRRTMSEWVGFMTWDTGGIKILDRVS